MESAEAELAALRAVVAKSVHDLANALGAVLNYSTFLREDLAGNAVAEDFLPHLEQAANRALALIGGLQDELVRGASRGDTPVA
jgi:signal transduction histidine kinase